MREGKYIWGSEYVHEKIKKITTENALNKAAHTTTTVNSELFAANDMELYITEDG